MSDLKLTADQIKDALGHCLGVYSIEADGRCEGCPLYEDHYCVDTLMSIVGGMIDEHFDAVRRGLEPRILNSLSGFDSRPPHKYEPPVGGR